MGKNPGPGLLYRMWKGRLPLVYILSKPINCRWASLKKSQEPTVEPFEER